MKRQPHGWALAALLVGGGDEAVLRPPPQLEIAPYTNATYRLERAVDGTVRVTVSAGVLGSHAVRPHGRVADGEVERLAWAIAGDGVTVYETVGRTLAWVSRNLRYELDRTAPQDAVAVLRRRSAYCTGFARSSVALLRALGVEAREVAGWDAEAGAFHRWIEVRYPDLGWVFSDPRASHHFVPATFVRLASEGTLPPAGRGRVVWRGNRLAALAEIPSLSSAVLVAPNRAPWRSAVSIDLGPEADGEAEVALVGGGAERRQRSTGGAIRFTDLEPGPYVVRLEVGARVVAARALEVEPASERSLSLRSGERR